MSPILATLLPRVLGRAGARSVDPRVVDAHPFTYSMNDPLALKDPAGLWTATLGISTGLALPGFGGGGGTNLNLGHDPNSSWLTGWSFSLTGTAAAGAVAGLGGGVGFLAMFTNACDVSQLLGTFDEFGRGGIGPFGVNYVWSPDRSVEGGSFTLTLSPTRWGVSGAALTTSTTSALAQWGRGGLSLGATDHGALFTLH